MNINGVIRQLFAVESKPRTVANAFPGFVSVEITMLRESAIILDHLDRFSIRPVQKVDLLNIINWHWVRHLLGWCCIVRIENEVWWQIRHNNLCKPFMNGCDLSGARDWPSSSRCGRRG